MDSLKEQIKNVIVDKNVIEAVRIFFQHEMETEEEVRDNLKKEMRESIIYSQKNKPYEIKMTMDYMEKLYPDLYEYYEERFIHFTQFFHFSLSGEQKRKIDKSDNKLEDMFKSPANEGTQYLN